MLSSTRASRPLHRRCSACRRIQEVRLSALYHLVVPNKGGGTRRDGGYDCRYCGFENVVAANEMPAGLVLTLPSRSAYRDSLERAQQAQVADTFSVPRPDEAASATSPDSTGNAIDALPVESPSLARETAEHPSPPAWIAGSDAKKALLRAHSRSEQDPSGHCTGFLRAPDGRLAALDMRGEIETSNILDRLDAMSCELLVVGGATSTGGHWKMIFHPLAGAASLVEEPA